MLFDLCVATLLRLGADASRANHEGRTALHWIASAGFHGCNAEAVVAMLVDGGCDAAARNADGQTAGEVAARWARTEWGMQFDEWVRAAGARGSLRAA